MPIVKVWSLANRNGLPSRKSFRRREFLDALESHSAGDKVQYVCLKENVELEELKHHAKDEVGHLIFWNRLPKCEDVLNLLLKGDSPIVVFDEANEFPTDKIGASIPLRIYRLPTRQAGRQMGEHFLHKGHKRMGFLTPYHTHLWSRSRLQGLRDAYSGRSGEETVVTFATVSESDLREGKWFPGPLERFLPGQKTFYRLGVPLGSTVMDASVREELFELMEHIDQKEEMQIHMRAAFEAALSEKTTGWLCANDLVALSALDFLKSRKTHLDVQIAVAGFDNTLHGRNAGLTSYDFGIEEMIRGALYFVKHSKPGVEIHEMQGAVMERESTA